MDKAGGGCGGRWGAGGDADAVTLRAPVLANSTKPSRCRELQNGLTFRMTCSVGEAKTHFSKLLALVEEGQERCLRQGELARHPAGAFPTQEIGNLATNAADLDGD